MKTFYFDIETTGTKYWRNGIHQISGAIEIDGELKESFDFKVAPHPDCDIDPEALNVGGVTEEQIKEYPAMRDVYNDIIKILSKYVDRYNKKDKFFLVGYNNSSFDNQFFRTFFVQNQDPYFGSWFWSNSMDVMVLASEYLKNDRHKMVDFKLKTVARQLGIEIDDTKLHDATYDIHITRQMYHILTIK